MWQDEVITIRNKDGEHTRQICAQVAHGMAVHNWIEEGGMPNPEWWSVTHVASGQNPGNRPFSSPKWAKRYALALAPLLADIPTEHVQMGDPALDAVAVYALAWWKMYEDGALA